MNLINWLNNIFPSYAYAGEAGAFLPEIEQVKSEPLFQSGKILGNSEYHTPVLPTQTLEAFKGLGERSVIVDCTLGGGGHSSLLCEQGHTVIAIDRDDEALSTARKRLAEFGDSFKAIKGNFSEIATLLQEIGITKIDGILADFGVSSHQLDEAERGFSFRNDGPLDMRMDQSNPLTAAVVVNTYSETDLLKIFREYGEERFSKKIADRICQKRAETPFSTTLELANFISTLVPKKEKIHPATRVFQAIRMEVNRELNEIHDLLEQSLNLLNPGGRLALISFHSLEDRIVKRFIAQHSKETIDRPEWPEPRANPDYHLKAITRKPSMADAEEISINARSRTAKLRVAQRI